MRPFDLTLIGLLATSLAGCSGANLKSASDYSAPAAPTVKHPYYNPYSPGSYWVPGW